MTNVISDSVVYCSPLRQTCSALSNMKKHELSPVIVPEVYRASEISCWIMSTGHLDRANDFI